MSLSWIDRGNLGGWTLLMLTFDRTGALWCVGTNYNTGKWNTTTYGWDNLGNLGGWTLNMLQFDQSGTMWCVGTNGNVGRWDPGLNQWEDLRDLGGWKLKMLTFDQNGTMWGIGTNGNVGSWDPTAKAWTNYGTLGNRDLNWIAFNPNEPGVIYCVGTDFNLYSYEIDSKQMTKIQQNWDLNMLTFSSSSFTFAVGNQGNIGYCPTSEIPT